MNAALTSLGRCVGDVQRFLEERWSREPHLHRTGDTAAYADLLSRHDVDHILTTMSLRYPAFRLVADGEPLDRSSYTRSGTIGGRGVNDLIDVGRVLDHHADGATIVLQGLHRYWPAVGRFCRDLEDVLTHPTQANAYITPPVASGLNVHHDTHDVLALQTDGEKDWIVYEPVIEHAVPGQHWAVEDHDADPVIDTTLRAGECLYLPRGTPHAARTVDRPSIHLTIGIRTYTWHDLLSAAVERAADDVTLRGSLPAGFAADPHGHAETATTRLKAAAELLRSVDTGGLMEDLADRFRRSRTPLLEGAFTELLDLDGITDATTVRLRPHVSPVLETDGDRLVIGLGDRQVTMPGAVAPAVRRLLDPEPVRVEELGEWLDDGSRLVLVRRLVREGMLVTRHDDVR